MTQKTHIPALRFPEFEGKSGWNERKLFEVLNEHGLKSSGKEEVHSVSVHKGVINQIEHLGRRFASESTGHYKLVLPDDIIYTKSPTGDFPFGIIKQNKLNKQVIVSPLYGVFTPETPHLGYILDSYFESTANTSNYLSSIVQKGAKNTINIKNDTFLSKSLFLPNNKKEQQKIAACLSSLDNLIHAHTRKLETLLQYKKGLLQQLFPQAGENIPKLRFPEFEKDGEWEEKMLGEVGEPLMCKRILKEQTTHTQANNIPFFKIGTFGKKPDAFISRELFQEYKKKYSYPNVGEILISASGTIGRLVIYNGTPAYFQDSNIVWLANDERLVLNSYLYHAYSVMHWKPSEGGIISRLYNSNLKEMKIRFPVNLLEQQKIASCLSSIDKKIEAQSTKLAQLKTHKKGLMQGLFPVAN